MNDREKVLKALVCRANDPVVNCAGCPYHVADWNCCDFQQICRDALSLLKSQSSAWISVKERLPELNQEVLVYAVGKIDGFIGESTMALTDRMIFRLFPSSRGEETWSSPWQYFHTDYEITHWMPLPEPPKGEDDA